MPGGVGGCERNLKANKIVSWKEGRTRNEELVKDVDGRLLIG